MGACYHCEKALLEDGWCDECLDAYSDEMEADLMEDALCRVTPPDPDHSARLRLRLWKEMQHA